MSRGGADVESIFTAAQDLPPGPGRDAYLAEACGADTRLRQSVEELLTALERASEVSIPAGEPSTLDAEDATAAFQPTDSGRTAGIEPSAVEAEVTADAATLDDNAVAPGFTVRYFGDYEIRRELGRGGMGVVYEARQISLNRPVALKMVKAGLLAGEEELRRFRNEAEAIALLDHPGIVPVYEVGEHDSQHFFSMKLVPGGSLVAMLDRYREEPRAAARLLREAAEAVAHAHARGILHRDLKPANILVDDQGHPHVTDFGLARKIEPDVELTQSGAILGTPAYMSPEQATGRRGAITTATDVYGLGAVLYALLTGQAPFGGDSVVETIDAVRNNPPKPLTSLNAHVPRDLETICLKCLEKDPRRRYSTAQAVADDLRAWLESRPIAARPAGVAERLWLWCRRRPAVAALTAAVVSLLIAGVAFAFAWGRQQAELARRKTMLADQQTMAADRERALRLEADRRRVEAEREAAKAGAVKAFLVDDILSQAAPEKNPRSRGVTVEDTLDLASPKVAERFAGQPDVETAVRTMIGDTYRRLGRLGKAEPHLRRALDLGSSFHGELDPDTLEAMNSLATLLQDQDKLAEAEPLFRRALDGCMKAFGPNHERTFSILNNYALILHLLGKMDEAEDAYRKLTGARTAAQGPEHPGTLMTKHNLAGMLRDRGRLAESELLLREVSEGFGRALSPAHPDTLRAKGLLGSVLLARDKPAEAEALHRQVLEARREVEGPEHPRTLNAMNVLALTLLRRGKLEEANSLIRQCLVIRDKIGQSPHHDDRLATVNILATILQENACYAEAESYFREILASMRRTRGETHPRTLTVTNNLALVLLLQGKLDEAESLYKWILSIDPPGAATPNPSTLQRENSLANVLLDKGEPAAAEPMAREAAEGRRKVLGPAHRDTLNALETWGESLLGLGRYAEAEPLLREAIDRRREAGGESPYGEHLLGGCLAATGRHAEAEPLLVGGFQKLRDRPTMTRARLRRAVDRIVSMYEAWGRPEQAAHWRLVLLDLAMPSEPFATVP